MHTDLEQCKPLLISYVIHVVHFDLVSLEWQHLNGTVAAMVWVSRIQT